MRKTIKVDEVLNMINSYLAHPDTHSIGREAIMSFAEGVLMTTGNYKGFRYLDTNEVEGAGTRVEYIQ
jgi:hypothetical protein